MALGGQPGPVSGRKTELPVLAAGFIGEGGVAGLMYIPTLIWPSLEQMRLIIRLGIRRARWGGSSRLVKPVTGGSRRSVVTRAAAITYPPSAVETRGRLRR